MKHMKMTETEQKGTESAVAVNRPEYPYGLEVRLDEQSLKKLGIKDLPAVGTKMELAAKVHVSNAMMHDGTDGKHRSIALQITHMELAKGRDREATDGETKGKKLYGGEKEK